MKKYDRFASLVCSCGEMFLTVKESELGKNVTNVEDALSVKVLRSRRSISAREHHIVENPGHYTVLVVGRVNIEEKVDEHLLAWQIRERKVLLDSETESLNLGGMGSLD